MVSNDEKWTYVGCEFKEIDLNKIEGRNFPSKLESLMAVFTRTTSWHIVYFDIVNNNKINIWKTDILFEF